MWAKRVLAGIVGSLCVAGTGLVSSAVAAPATESQSITAQEWMTLKINNLVRRTSNVDDISEQMFFFFRRNDVDGGGFSKSDIALVGKINAARKRARMLERWSRKDINGDGRVSLTELTQYYYPKVSLPVRSNGIRILPNTAQMEKALLRILKREMVFDTNQDGYIDFPEVMQAAKKQRKTRFGRKFRYLTRYGAKMPKSLDTNKDKVISADEFRAVVTAALDSIDRDGDGELSRREKIVLRKKVQLIRKKQQLTRLKRFRQFRSNRYNKKYDRKL